MCPFIENIIDIHFFQRLLEGMARYAGQLLALAESFGVWPRLFVQFGQKKGLLLFLFLAFTFISLM